MRERGVIFIPRSRRRQTARPVVVASNVYPARARASLLYSFFLVAPFRCSQTLMALSTYSAATILRGSRVFCESMFYDDMANPYHCIGDFTTKRLGQACLCGTELALGLGSTVECCAVAHSQDPQR
eukprot:3769705-Pleurochrysis_carterae.AAC.1